MITPTASSVSLRAVHIVAQADQSGKYLALAGATVLPSLLFTSYAGQLADAISKRKLLAIRVICPRRRT